MLLFNFNPAVSTPLVSKGLAPQVVQLLKPFVQEGSRSLMTNSAFCLSQLLRTEQHLLKLQQQQAAEQPAAEQQQQQREVPPVAAAVLDHINLMKLAEPQGPGNSRKGFFFQVCALQLSLQLCKIAKLLV